MGRFIPLSIPNFEGNEEKYVGTAIAEGWVSTGGAYIDRLEEDLKGYLEVPAVAAVQSGTAGLHLSLLECSVQPGDHVIVPSLTFIAAVNPVKYLYGEPIFMDCDDSLCMDVQKLKRFLAEECTLEEKGLIYKATGRQIKALIIVHVFGNLGDMEEIMELCNQYKLKVIEDATEALGTYYLEGDYQGKKAGTMGDFGVFSFNGNKIITSGGGGAVTGKDIDAVKHIKYLSTQAKDDDLYYIHNEVGYNYRMTNVQAAIGVAQLEELEEFIKRKNNNYRLYEESLTECELCRLLKFRENTYSNRWFYALDIDIEKIDLNIKEIITALQKKGIQTRPIWGLIHEQEPYRKSIHYQIEKAVYYSKRIINIPCSTNITEEDISYVAKEIRELLLLHRV